MIFENGILYSNDKKCFPDGKRQIVYRFATGHQPWDY